MLKEFGKEQFGRENIETKEGIIVYKVYDDKSLYIHILYIKPEYRGKGFDKVLEQMVIDKHHPSTIYNYVDLESNCPEQSLICILRNNYKILKATPDRIILYKELNHA